MGNTMCPKCDDANPTKNENVINISDQCVDRLTKGKIILITEQTWRNTKVQYIQLGSTSYN